MVTQGAHQIQSSLLWTGMSLWYKCLQPPVPFKCSGNAATMWYQKYSDPSSFLLFVEKRKLSHHPERYLFPCYCYLFWVIIIFKPTVSSAMTPITSLASYQALVIVSRFDQKDFGFLVVFCYFSHAATSLGAVSLLIAPPWHYWGPCLSLW